MTTSAERRLYLDHNATSPLLQVAAEAMESVRRDADFNPASGHEEGRRARRRLEAARTQLAESLGTTGRIVFTSGATEANNLAILGLAARREGPIVASGLEHASVTGPLAQLARAGREVRLTPATPAGDVDVAQFRDQLAPEAALALCTAASGETGGVTPHGAIAKACREGNVPWVVDAAQAAGRLPLRVDSLGAAAVVVSSHKLGGPRGVGAVVLAGDVEPAPRTFGGFQQEGLRPGTECPVLAAGFAAAVAWWVDQGATLRERLAALRDLFEQELRRRIPAVAIHAGGIDRLPQTSCLQFPGVEGQRMQIALDARGLACSLGSACASGSPEPSATLLAMGLSREAAMQSLRFSFGPLTDEHQVREAAERILFVYNRLR